MQAPEQCDVLVIGGGPAGSTIATLLAREGRRVVLLEKEHHPRFHIGESLLPGNVELFDKLGVREAVEKIGMPKFGIEFVPPDLDYCSYVDFSEGWDPSMASAWQVRRSELDELLFRNAGKVGAQAIEGARVHEVDIDSAGATVRAVLGDGEKRSWRARFLVDASGRDTVLANKFKCKKKNPNHNSTALFGHFRNARRLQGKREGNISICWFEHGWFWFIPLADGTTSVGAVCWAYYLKARDKPLKEYFYDTIALCPELADRLKDATLVDDKVHATGNFAYASTHATGDRYLIIGDAFTFIDPMFSSGVFLAMQSAFDGAKLVATALDRPPELPAARQALEKRMRVGPRDYSWFIYRVTNPTIRDMFMHPQNVFKVKQGLMSLLAADIHHGAAYRRSLFMFKVVYYFVSALNWRRTYDGWKRHRFNIRDMGLLRGETIMKSD
ncbi:NAD(P)/FAD-dependent oxidoreductase [Variovorax sp. DT-64]|uniref:NAD(P)/FAD-dependent oxidoreductase n=1 Tax=Variovorax sp. DT-64 TaxID=3396160 RepID=UPI003F19E0CE